MRNQMIDGLYVEFARIPDDENTLFVTLLDDGCRRHHFSLKRTELGWGIRNPSTVPLFIVSLEASLVAQL